MGAPTFADRRTFGYAFAGRRAFAFAYRLVFTDPRMFASLRLFFMTGKRHIWFGHAIDLP